MRFIKREVSSKNIYTINMNVTEGTLKISTYNGDLIEINGSLGFWTRNIRTYTKDNMAFIEIKPRLFKPVFVKTTPSEIEVKVPREYKMNLNLYLGKVDTEISDLKLNILSIKSSNSDIKLVNVKSDVFNVDKGKGNLSIEEYEKYEEVDNLGIIETETGLAFAKNQDELYIDTDIINKDKKDNKDELKQLAYGNEQLIAPSSKDIIINNSF